MNNAPDKALELYNKGKNIIKGWKFFSSPDYSKASRFFYSSW